MSADNYGVIAPFEDGWGVWMGFSSDEMDDKKLIESKKPMKQFFTRDECFDYCSHEYFEYGYHTYLPPMTEKQKELYEKHGTPDDFADAVNIAADRLMVTTEEANAAIYKYRQEWTAAGA